MVTSPLSAETRSYLQGLREVEWALAFLHELLLGRNDFLHRESYASGSKTTAVTDWFDDHRQGFGSGGGSRPLGGQT